MADIIRAGMIGCDTSHCPKFTQIFHENESINGDGPPVRVVACYPSFSPDIKSSVGRVEKFKKELSCTKIYNNGSRRKINCKKQSWFRAVSPTGTVLHEAKKFSNVRSFAQGNTTYTMR